MRTEADHGVGSVRRTMHEHGVTLHVAGSRNALIGAAILALVPGACIAAAVFMFILWHAQAPGSWRVGVVEMIGITSIVGVAVLPCLAIASMLRRLLRTGFRRVTFEVDAEQLHLLARGYDRPRRLTWGRDIVRDVIVHHGGDGWLHELHIILGGEPPVSLLCGADKAELEFIASELRRALNIDVRRRSVAGWWGNEAEAIDDDDDDDDDMHVDERDGATPILDYAPELVEHPVTERSAISSRVLIPPPSPKQILWQVAGPTLALCIGVAIISRAKWFDATAIWTLIWTFCICAVILATSISGPLLDCVRHRCIELDASEVTLTTRIALGGGETVKRWPSESVRDIVADGKAVVLRLRDGRAEPLATCPTPAQAAALARALRPPPPEPPEPLTRAEPVE